MVVTEDGSGVWYEGEVGVSLRQLDKRIERRTITSNQRILFELSTKLLSKEENPLLI